MNGMTSNLAETLLIILKVINTNSLLMQPKSSTSLVFSNRIISEYTAQKHPKDPQGQSKKPSTVKKIIPRITIRVDQLIRETYSNLATGKLKNVTDSQSVLNNDALVEYIRAIYQAYDIEDPMARCRRMSSSGIVAERTPSKDLRDSGFGLNHPMKSAEIQSTIQRSRNRSTSRKKIQQLKESIRDGVNFQPVEVRKISLSTLRPSTQNIKRKIMYGTPQKNGEDRHPYCDEIIKTEKIKRPNEENQNQKTPEISMFLQRQTSEIQPIFRFCFLCESPIMQANIQSHQKKCPRFMELYKLDCQGLVRMLVEKITRIKRQIHGTMNQPNKTQDTQEDLKERVELFMKNVENAQANGLRFGKDYEKSYQEIGKVLDRKCFKLLQLTNKLKWFLKMRQNIQKAFHI